MYLSWFFIILAIVCALFSGAIDRAVGGHQVVRKVILVFSGGVLLVSIIGLAAM